MPFIKTTGANPTDIHYYDQGTGTPVVLIHGWPLSHRMWESQTNAMLAAGYRVVAYDRRGFGESGKPERGYDYDTLASDVNDLMTQLDLRGAAIAGFSMGGGEVARYLGRYGSARVAKAMLLGAVTPYLLKTDDNPDGVPKAVFDGMLAGVKKDRVAFLAEFFPNFYNLADGKGDNPDLIPFSKWVAWGASPLATQQCIVSFGETDFRADLEKITIPVLVVHGDKDRIVPIDKSGARAQELITNSTYVVIKGAPHGFAATHAEKLNELMLEFLKD